jgi:hypothetical protein
MPTKLQYLRYAREPLSARVLSLVTGNRIDNVLGVLGSFTLMGNFRFVVE